MIEWLNNIDTQLFLFLNGLHSPFWDSVMWFASGKYTWAPFYAVVLFLLFRKERKKIWIVVLSIVLLITLSDQISVKLFKNVFERLRPCHNEAIGHLVHLVNNKCGGQFGFVSSHAANSFALATFVSVVFNNRYFYMVMFFWAFFVSYSRIYLGVHYPGDILGGALLGILVGIVVHKIYFYISRKVYPKNEPSLTC